MLIAAALLAFVATATAEPAKPAAAPAATDGKRRVDEDKGDSDPGSGGGGGVGDVKTPTCGNACVDVPLQMLDCELCNPTCKLGGLIGLFTGGVIGLGGGAAVGWFLLTNDQTELDARLTQTGTAALIGAIGVGAVGVVTGAVIGWGIGALAPQKAAPPKKKKPPRKKR